MALARKRDWYFEASWFWTIVWAILTLGIWPLLLQSYRFDRFRRLEWNQYDAYALWMAHHVDKNEANTLAGIAFRWAGPPSWRVIERSYAMAALAVAIYILVTTGDLLAVARAVYSSPVAQGRPITLYGMCLGIGYLWFVRSVMRQSAMTTAWLRGVNRLLESKERRPVPLPPRPRAWVKFVWVVPIAIFLPMWASMMIGAVLMQNHYIASTRAIRLALLERMLEWMDTSGLPVEFDIEEVEPGELVDSY